MVVAHDLDSAEYIFGIGKLFYDLLDVPERPALVRDTTRGLRFKAPHFGSLLVDTSKNVRAGRSLRLQYLHCSEVAGWEGDPKQTATGLMSAVSNSPKTMIVLESTANGQGGYFYDEWLKAVAGKSDFEAVFFAWHEFPAYALRVIDPTFGASLSPRELQMQQKYGLSLEQLAWYRWALENKCQGDEMLMRQEYPSSADEAFIATGRPRFDAYALDGMPILEPVRGVLRRVDRIYGPGVEFVSDPYGWLAVWQRPQPHASYVLGTDVALGIAKDDSGRKHDYSCSAVLDKRTGRQVALLHGHFEPDEFGHLNALLGEWYNFAFSGIEVIGSGETVFSVMKSDGYPMRALYADPEANRPGWNTNVKTRAIMVDDLAQAIRERSVLIHDMQTVMECRSFAFNKRGKPEAISSCFDDRVIALGIAWQMIKHAPSEPVSEQSRARQLRVQVRERKQSLPERPSRGRSGY